VRQVLPDWQNWRVSVLGTDINTHSLRKAMHGVYGEWSFRDVPAGFRERYFELTDEGRYSVRPEVRSCVRFAQMNLAQDGFPSLATDTNAMDIVLCRNVLIYFEPSQATTLIGKLRRSLMEDGWLVVSASEYSQTLFSEFAVTNFPGAVLYRKTHMQAPGHARDSRATMGAWVPAPDVAAAGAIAPASPCAASVPGASRSSNTLAAANARMPAAASALAAPTVLQPADFARLTRARANEGRLDEALDWSERWIVADKLDAAAHYLQVTDEHFAKAARPKGGTESGTVEGGMGRNGADFSALNTKKSPEFPAILTSAVQYRKKGVPGRGRRAAPSRRDRSGARPRRR